MGKPTHWISLLCVTITISFQSFASGVPNLKSKCSIECFTDCMTAGTLDGILCNCPVIKEQKNCTKYDEELKNAVINQNLPKTRTKYIDAHTIHVSISPHPAAFAYIFEYSTITSEPDEWIYASAGSAPESTFQILDPCRDYQFRVITVIRSSTPTPLYEIVRQQPIPVQLPPFVLKQDQIHVDMPKIANSSSNHIKMFVKWTLPNGYADGDIYGYESPALYPVQCSTPEEELPQPKIEIVKGGGRLSVSLPASVLETRCRMWTEVRMLPRCVRLEAFSIQKSIEIDCSKNTDLEVCSKDANPVCFDELDISGEQGKAQISWTKSALNPIYYHVRYGPAQTKGVAPFVSWQLAAKREVRVDGSLTSFTLDVPEDEDFGVQVCAILSMKRKRAKFGVVKVTPFLCSSCRPNDDERQGKCGACAPIIGSTVLESAWKTDKPAVYRLGQELSVAKAETRHEAAVPLDLEKAEKINEDDAITSSSTTTTTSAPSTTTTSTTTTTTTTTRTPSTTYNQTFIEKSVELLEDLLLVANESDPSVQTIQDTITTILANSSEVRMHERNRKCLTSDGIVCEFGCATKKICVCPMQSHARLRNGACVSRESMLHTQCLPRRNINATWDAEKGNIMVRRGDAQSHLESAELVDKLLVEFGQIGEPNNSSEPLHFIEPSTRRNRIVVSIQSLLKLSVFQTSPFVFHVNRSIDMTAAYGMRFCAFNSSQVKNPHNYNWDDESKFEEDDQIAKVIQVSPVYFTNQLFAAKPTNFWSALATIGKIAILVLLAIAMLILVYLNCTKIKSMYNRKRTHYFRPFYIDPSIHLSSTIPARPGTGLKRQTSHGY